MPRKYIPVAQRRSGTDALSAGLAASFEPMIRQVTAAFIADQMVDWLRRNGFADRLRISEPEAENDRLRTVRMRMGSRTVRPEVTFEDGE